MDRKREREREDNQIILIILMFHIKIKIDDSLTNELYKSPLWILVTYPMPGCREEGLKGTIATCDLSKAVF